MSTLRVTFLSSLILELVATIAVALVAVAIGLRLMDGQLDLRTALFALVLAPEAYLPLRRLGANYHASAEGMAAAEQVFAVLETPAAPRGTRTDVPDPALAGLTIEGLRVTYPGRSEPALDGVSLTIGEGEALALVGPSGCGKSTLLGVLLGLLTPELGRSASAASSWPSSTPMPGGRGWRGCPSARTCSRRRSRENVRLGRHGASNAEVWDAISAAGLTDVVRQLPARPGHGARRPWRRAVRGGAPAGRAGPRVFARRAAAAAR